MLGNEKEQKLAFYYQLYHWLKQDSNDQNISSQLAARSFLTMFTFVGIFNTDFNGFDLLFSFSRSKSFY